jgi:hypothetical protein
METERELTIFNFEIGRVFKNRAGEIVRITDIEVGNDNTSETPLVQCPLVQCRVIKVVENYMTPRSDNYNFWAPYGNRIINLDDYANPSSPDDIIEELSIEEYPEFFL